MNGADFIFLLCLLAGAYFGYQKGLLQTVLLFTALVIALVLSFKLLDVTLVFLEEKTGFKNKWAIYAAFLLIFIAVCWILVIIGKQFSESLNKTILGSFDKVAGAALGMVKYAFGISVLLWLTHLSQLDRNIHSLHQSMLYPYLFPLAPETFAHLHEWINFHELFSSFSR